MVFAMVADSSAQRLLETDGIELRGTARVVTYAAGICNVVEASHIEAEYERIKANHGQPLDVWQLDFSVYNGSGEWLEHLIARYGIGSKWPDCTNWSGPSGTYSEPVQWANTIGPIQKSGRKVVTPGATLAATKFIIAFHEDQPRFENWSVDFTFGGSSSAPEGPSYAVGSRLPPASPPRPPAEERPVAEAEYRRQASGISSERTCTGQEQGAACWKGLASHPGCHVWDPHYYADQTVAWTGLCSGSKACGTGTLKWIRGSEVTESSGLIRDGKRNGHWVERHANGTVSEGLYADGKRNGNWVIRDADGDFGEGPVVDGKRNGLWMRRDPTGKTTTETCVDGRLE